MLLVEGEGMRKCDTIGGAIWHKQLDLLVPTHEEALKRGRVKRKVWKLWRTR